MKNDLVGREKTWEMSNQGVGGAPGEIKNKETSTKEKSVPKRLLK